MQAQHQTEASRPAPFHPGDIGQEMTQPEGESLASLGIQPTGVKAARSRLSSSRPQATAAASIKPRKVMPCFERAVVDPIAGSIHLKAAGHRFSEILHMADLGDRGAIAWKRDRPVVERSGQRTNARPGCNCRDRRCKWGGSS